MFLFIPFSSLFFRFIPFRGSPPLLPSRAERSGDPGSRRPWERRRKQTTWTPARAACGGPSGEARRGGEEVGGTFPFLPFHSLFFRFLPVRGSPPPLPSRAERSGDPGSRRPWGRGKNKQPGPRLAPPVAARPGRQEGERRMLGGTFPFVPFHSLSFPFIPFQGLPPLLPSIAERS